MKFTATEWTLLSTLLDEALDLPPLSQPAWIEGLSDLAPGLKSALTEMLIRNRETEDHLVPLTLPRLTVPHSVEQNASPGFEPGLAVGSYRLVRELGRGGMGAVWLADRVDGALTRQVALKLPHAIHDAHFPERFRRERDILATFTHPNIAQIYDAGVSQDGRPFIALEYVEGDSLLRYCDARRLELKERLAIFLQILSAVQYAHGHLVIHRDLKPGNILVGNSGKVKLLDFGIAKLLTGGGASESELTQAGARPLTLDYAAPEQLAGEPVSTVSDVYSLGVVLCELLAGARPWPRRRNLMLATDDAIGSVAVARPSELIRGAAASAGKETAPARATTPKKLKAALRGDLDTIVLKALRAEPGDRYASADAFAQDIRRYLQGEAVLAQPDRLAYRLRKFISRHRIAVAATVGVVAALAFGLGAALWQARVANREARASRAVEGFLEDIFRANSEDQPDPAKARLTTARELLDIGAGKVKGGLKDAPDARLQVLGTLGRMYLDLGEDDKAVALIRERLTLAKSVRGANSPEVAAILVDLGVAMHSSRSVNERHTVLVEAKELLDRLGDSTSTTRGDLLRTLAEEYQSTDRAKAVDFAHQSVVLYRRNHQGDGLLQALYMEGMLRQQRSEWNLALPLFSEAISLSKKTEGDPNPDLPRLYALQGEVYQSNMQLSAAEQSLRGAFAAAQKLNGDDHVDTIQTGLRLGIFLVDIARSKEGLQYLEKATDTVLRVRGADDPFHTPAVLLEYGNALARTGRIEEGLVYIDQAVANRRKNRPGTLFLAQMLENRASWLIDLGNYEEAAKLLDEASAIQGKVDDHSDRLIITTRVKLFVAMGKPEVAAAWMADTYGHWPKTSRLSTDYLGIMRDDAAIALGQARADDAGDIAGKVRRELAASPERPSLKNWEAEFDLLAGNSLLKRNRPADALPLLTAATDLRSGFLDPVSLQLAEALVPLGECELQMGDRDGAQFQAGRARTILAAHAKVGEPYRVQFNRLYAALRRR